MFFVSYKCTNDNVLISTRALRLTAGDGPQGVFLTLFERINVFKINDGEPKKQNIPENQCSSRGAAKSKFSESALSLKAR